MGGSRHPDNLTNETLIEPNVDKQLHFQKNHGKNNCKAAPSANTFSWSGMPEQRIYYRQPLY